MADENAVLARIEKLEASNRRLKLLATGPLLALCVLFVSGQARPNRKIEAQEFVLLDSNGSKIADLAASPDRDGACLILRKQSDAGAAVLCNGKAIGASLASEGSGKLELVSDNRLSGKLLGGAQVWLYSPSGINTLSLSGYSPLSQGSEVSLTSDDASSGTSLEADNKGSFLTMIERQGGSAFVSATQKEAHMGVTDSEGFSATVGSESLVTERTGEQRQRSAASMVLFGKDKKVLWSAP
jgi:hypothetical protein